MRRVWGRALVVAVVCAMAGCDEPSSGPAAAPEPLPWGTDLVYRVVRTSTEPVHMEGLKKAVLLRARFAGFDDAKVYVSHGNLVVRVFTLDEKGLLPLKGAIANSGHLEFRLVAENGSKLEEEWKKTGDVPEGYTVYGIATVLAGKSVVRKVLVSDHCEMTGECITEAKADAPKHQIEVQVTLKFTREGSQRFGDVTKRYVGRKLAIVIDTQRDANGNIIGKNVDEVAGTEPPGGLGYTPPLTPGKGTCISAPVIQGPIYGDVTLSGDFTMSEARALAIALTGGPLSARLVLEKETRIGGK